MESVGLTGQTGLISPQFDTSGINVKHFKPEIYLNFM